MSLKAAHIISSATVVTALGIAALSPITPRLLYNPSPSAPIGFYLPQPKKSYREGDLVAAFPPDWAQKLAVERGYLAPDIPVIKSVWAGPGASVCRRDDVVSTPSRCPLSALAADSAGRSMPVWTGCITLADNEYFLISEDVQGSFDSRYFGPVQSQEIVGAVRLLSRMDDRT